MLSWRHSGFSVHHAIRVDPHDTEGLERLCRYLVHPPNAVGRLGYDGIQATYRARRRHRLTVEESVTLDPLQMLARLCQHIPPTGLHLTRLYGAYSNRTRGARARRMAGAGKEPGSPRSEPPCPAPSQRERARQWTRIRVVSILLDPAVIRKILEHRPRAEPRAHAPRAGGHP
ncbi:MAG: transposase [Planctomycetota bacterium]